MYIPFINIIYVSNAKSKRTTTPPPFKVNEMKELTKKFLLEKLRHRKTLLEKSIEEDMKILRIFEKDNRPEFIEGSKLFHDIIEENNKILKRIEAQIKALE